jgi:DNA recombination protein RmuC
MSLLWGVAYGWQQDARARQALQVGDIAADLHQRFAQAMQHLHKTGRSLNTAVNSYNALVSSLENQVLPRLRKLEELGIVAHGSGLPPVQLVETQARPVPSAPDPLDTAEP